MKNKVVTSLWCLMFRDNITGIVKTLIQTKFIVMFLGLKRAGSMNSPSING